MLSPGGSVLRFNLELDDDPPPPPPDDWMARTGKPYDRPDPNKPISVDVWADMARHFKGRPEVRYLEFFTQFRDQYEDSGFSVKEARNLYERFIAPDAPSFLGDLVVAGEAAKIKSKLGLFARHPQRDLQNLLDSLKFAVQAKVMHTVIPTFIKETERAADASPRAAARAARPAAQAFPTLQKFFEHSTKANNLEFLDVFELHRLSSSIGELEALFETYAAEDATRPLSPPATPEQRDAIRRALKHRKIEGALHAFGSLQRSVQRHVDRDMKPMFDEWIGGERARDWNALSAKEWMEATGKSYERPGPGKQPQAFWEDLAGFTRGRPASRTVDFLAAMTAFNAEPTEKAARKIYDEFLAPDCEDPIESGDDAKNAMAIAFEIKRKSLRLDPLKDALAALAVKQRAELRERIVPAFIEHVQHNADMRVAINVAGEHAHEAQDAYAARALDALVALGGDPASDGIPAALAILTEQRRLAGEDYVSRNVGWQPDLLAQDAAFQAALLKNARLLTSDQKNALRKVLDGSRLLELEVAIPMVVRVPAIVRHPEIPVAMHALQQDLRYLRKDLRIDPEPTLPLVDLKALSPQVRQVFMNMGVEVSEVGTVWPRWDAIKDRGVWMARAGVKESADALDELEAFIGKDEDLRRKWQGDLQFIRMHRKFAERPTLLQARRMCDFLAGSIGPEHAWADRISDLNQAIQGNNLMEAGDILDTFAERFAGQVKELLIPRFKESRQQSVDGAVANGSATIRRQWLGRWLREYANRETTLETLVNAVTTTSNTITSSRVRPEAQNELAGELKKLTLEQLTRIAERLDQEQPRELMRTRSKQLQLIWRATHAELLAHGFQNAIESRHYLSANLAPANASPSVRSPVNLASEFAGAGSPGPVVGTPLPVETPRSRGSSSGAPARFSATGLRNLVSRGRRPTPPKLLDLNQRSFALRKGQFPDFAGRLMRPAGNNFKDFEDFTDYHSELASAGAALRSVLRNGGDPATEQLASALRGFLTAQYSDPETFPYRERAQLEPLVGVLEGLQVNTQAVRDEIQRLKDTSVESAVAAFDVAAPADKPQKFLEAVHAWSVYQEQRELAGERVDPKVEVVIRQAAREMLKDSETITPQVLGPIRRLLADDQDDQVKTAIDEAQARFEWLEATHRAVTQVEQQRVEKRKSEVLQSAGALAVVMIQHGNDGNWSGALTALNSVESNLAESTKEGMQVDLVDVLISVLRAGGRDQQFKEFVRRLNSLPLNFVASGPAVEGPSLDAPQRLIRLRDTLNQRMVSAAPPSLQDQVDALNQLQSVGARTLRAQPAEALRASLGSVAETARRQDEVLPVIFGKHTVNVPRSFWDELVSGTVYTMTEPQGVSSELTAGAPPDLDPRSHALQKLWTFFGEDVGKMNQIMNLAGPDGIDAVIAFPEFSVDGPPLTLTGHRTVTVDISLDAKGNPVLRYGVQYAPTALVKQDRWGMGVPLGERGAARMTVEIVATPGGNVQLRSPLITQIVPPSLSRSQRAALTPSKVTGQVPGLAFREAFRQLLSNAKDAEKLVLRRELQRMLNRGLVDLEEVDTTTFRPLLQGLTLENDSVDRWSRACVERRMAVAVLHDDDDLRAATAKEFAESRELTRRPIGLVVDFSDLTSEEHQQLRSKLDDPALNGRQVSLPQMSLLTGVRTSLKALKPTSPR